MHDPLLRDARLILASRAVRGVGYGFVAVILASYLEALGAGAALTGAVLGVALASVAALNLLAGRVADRVGRRRFLALTGLLMLAAALVLFATRSIEGAVLACAVGSLSPTAMEVGPFLTVEQAILPQVSGRVRPADVFARYNLVGALAAAFGALLSGGAGALGAWAGGDEVTGFRLMFLAYGCIGVAAAALALLMTGAVEEPTARAERAARAIGPEGRRTIRSLAALFSLDSFAGGMVIRTFTAYWLVVTFSPRPETLGAVFFAANLLSGLSFLVAARLTRRLGLVRTMVYTHIPSNIMLAVLPLAPTFEVAAAVLVLRLSVSQMDVAPRQLLVVSVVQPHERTAAAATTNTARNVAQAGGPFAIGAIASATFLGAPFVIAGALKIVYDLSLLRRFGAVEARASAETGGGPAGAPRDL